MNSPNNKFSKAFSYDGKGATAGNPEPNPDKDSVEAISEHVIELNKNQPLQTKATLEQRDSNRWELDPGSRA